MTETQLDQLRFPIGKFKKPEIVAEQQIHQSIETLKGFPKLLRETVAKLNDAQLDTRYRPEGWTLRQVVHHLADSHMNALIRYKLMLTEETPTIKPYREALFAELIDGKQLPIAPSLSILDGVHERMIALIQSVNPLDYSREYIHPEYGTRYRLDQAIVLYAWHCQHHLAHITVTMERENWN